MDKYNITPLVKPSNLNIQYLEINSNYDQKEIQEQNKVNQKELEHKELENNNPSFWKEFLDFWNELWSMIYNDAYNSYLFLKANKKYITTAVVLAFLMQFTNISNLGASFDKYCNKQIKHLQSGGGGIQVQTYQEAGQLRAEAEARAKQAKKEEKAQKKLEQRATDALHKDIKKRAEAIQRETSKSKGNDGKYKSISKENAMSQAQTQVGTFSQKKQDLQLSDKQASHDAEMKKGSKEVAKGFATKMKEKKFSDDLLKANQERLSFFEGLKNKFSGSSLSSTLGGPLFGKMDLIFDTVKNIFYFIGLILMFAGVVSLPVLIFLIITYMVFKSMVSKFVIL